jgi:hypothetical protein
MGSVARPDWVVIRDDSAHEVLTPDGRWSTIDEAQWFSSYDDAAAAPLPAGTLGTPQQQHPDAHD